MAVCHVKPVDVVNGNSTKTLALTENLIPVRAVAVHVTAVDAVCVSDLHGKVALHILKEPCGSGALLGMTVEGDASLFMDHVEIGLIVLCAGDLTCGRKIISRWDPLALSKSVGLVVFSEQDCVIAAEAVSKAVVNISASFRCGNDCDGKMGDGAFAVVAEVVCESDEVKAVAAVAADHLFGRGVTVGTA